MIDLADLEGEGELREGVGEVVLLVWSGIQMDKWCTWLANY